MCLCYGQVTSFQFTCYLPLWSGDQWRIRFLYWLLQDIEGGAVVHVIGIMHSLLVGYW